MANQGPSKNDINLIFKRLRSFATNKVCFDCSAKNPTWSSVTYGVFICIDCSAVHRSLGVHVSFVRSTQLDTNWTWLQLRAMQVGGNANAKSYFAQHNCTSADSQQKYNSRVAALYREKLHNMAVNAMRIHGTKLHIDASHEESSELSTPVVEKKEVDFFMEHTEATAGEDNLFTFDDLIDTHLNKLGPIKNGTLSEQPEGAGPNVDLSTSPTEMLKLSEARKPTIGQRRPGGNQKKGGLGGKKGGLGAQKVNADFSEIEKEAQLADQLKEKAVNDEKKSVEKSPEEEAQQIASMRLAYQDLSIQKKQAEDKLKQIDPKKATQLERLGMGFGARSGAVAHSAASEMKTIEQDDPNKANYSRVSNRDFFEDEFEIIGFTSGPPKYSDSPFSKEDKYAMYGSRNNEDKYSGSKNSTWDVEKKNILDSTVPFKEVDESLGRNRKGAYVTPAATSDEAVKKFGNAKSISSEQFFGNSMDSDFEKRTNLSRFEGSSSISSADYFGESSQSRQTSAAATYSGPDLDEIREGVRAGVTKVAGKLSSFANGVMTSLQDRYGY